MSRVVDATLLLLWLSRGCHVATCYRDLLFTTQILTEPIISSADFVPEYILTPNPNLLEHSIQYSSYEIFRSRFPLLSDHKSHPHRMGRAFARETQCRFLFSLQNLSSNQFLFLECSHIPTLFLHIIPSPSQLLETISAHPIPTTTANEPVGCRWIKFCLTIYDTTLRTPHSAAVWARIQKLPVPFSTEFNYTFNHGRESKARSYWYCH